MDNGNGAHNLSIVNYGTSFSGTVPVNKDLRSGDQNQPAQLRETFGSQGKWRGASYCYANKSPAMLYPEGESAFLQG